MGPGPSFPELPLFKKTLIAIVAVIVIVVAGAVALVAFVDADRFKPRIVQAVADRYQRTLVIDGRLSLSVFPRLALGVPATTLSEPRSSTEAARLGSARVSVALLPLVRGAIVADTIRLDGLSARIERRADGSTSIDDLLGRTAASTAAKPSPDGSTAEPGAGSPLSSLDIGGLVVTDARLVIDEGKAGGTTTVDRLNLETGRISSQGTTPVSLSLAFTRTEPKAAGEIDVKGDAVIDLDARRFGVRKLEGRLRATAGSQVIEQGRLSLAALDLDPARATIALTSLALNATGKSGPDPFDVTISVPKLAIADAAASGETAGATVKLGGASALEARVEASGLGGRSDALSIARLAIEATSVQGARRLAVKLATPVAADLTAGQWRLSALAGDLAVDDPRLPAKSARVALAGQASADTRREQVRADLAAKGEGTELAAKIAVDGFATPKIGVDVRGDRLDLDRFLPPAGGAAAPPTTAAPAASKAGATAASEPLDLGGLKTLNLDAKLAIGHLRARGLTAADVGITVKAAGGRLDAAPISAALYNGRLAGRATVQAGAAPAANRIDAAADLLGIAIGPLLKDLSDDALLEGRGDVKLNLQSTGGTVADLKRRLQGRAVVALRDGAIRGINLAETLRQARSLLQGGASPESRRSDDSKKTDFTSLDVTATITDGVARSDDLDVKSPLLRIGGEGSADLVASRLDYTVRASVVGTGSGQGGRDLEALRGVTIPVRLTGSFDDPSWQIDWATAGREALKSRAAAELKERLQTDERVEKAKDKVRDRVGDALKGLFNR
jgi:AsmA protein